jgi:hypothetical protein
MERRDFRQLYTLFLRPYAKRLQTHQEQEFECPARFVYTLERAYEFLADSEMDLPNGVESSEQRYFSKIKTNKRQHGKFPEKRPERESSELTESEEQAAKNRPQVIDAWLLYFRDRLRVLADGGTRCSDTVRDGREAFDRLRTRSLRINDRPLSNAGEKD